MNTLGIILARAGSKGLPGKCLREVLGRALIEYTFDHALTSGRLSSIVLTTDCEEAKALARARGIEVIDRPAELATDMATVDAAARHAVLLWEGRRDEGTNGRREGVPPLPLRERGRGEGEGPRRPDVSCLSSPQDSTLTLPSPCQGEGHGLTPLSPPLLRGEAVDAVVLLYGNIPVRRVELIDEAVEKLIATGADSVRSVAPVTKQHPDWVHRLDGDRMVQFRPNSIYRRQDLEPLYYHDGAIVVVTRAALFAALKTPEDKQAFLGRYRRAIICSPEDAVDVDTAVDLFFAEAVLRRQSDEATKRRSDEGNDQLPVTSYHLPVTNDQGLRATTVFTSVALGGHRIGAGQPAFIIAEAGVNHNGDLDTALRMVDEAKRAGADAVKFQMFRAAELASRQAPTAEYQRARRKRRSDEATKRRSGGDESSEVEVLSQREMLARLELGDEAFERIAHRCKQQDIALIITPFGVQDVARIQALTPDPSPGGRGGGALTPALSRGERGNDSHDHCSQSSGTQVAAIKIASTDLTNGPLLEAAARTGLPLILSTGASTLDEVRTAVKRVREYGASGRLILLHCVSSYPTPRESINLRAMAALHHTFGLPVGLSDHTTSVAMGGWAVAAGACVLEKHFTLDRSAEGPDHAMSLTPDELREYIAGARQAEAALGDGMIGPLPIEQDVRTAARKSIVAARAIAAGTRITADMLTLKRPGTGIAPDHFQTVVGRVAAVDIADDTLLAWTMVK